MADSDTTRDDKQAKGDDKGILKAARERWDRARERERENIKLAYEDLEFLAGEQWPSKQKKERDNEGRPVLTINRLPQFVRQITGDIRQMKPAIKVVPVDNNADEKRAETIGGMIRYIENRSDASGIYFRAADSQVACGIGHWRIDREYADGSTFNQEIRVAPVEDGVAVLWDPDAKLPTKEDAKFCFVPVDISRARFEEDYPDIKPNEFDDDEWSGNSEWVTDDHVRIAEYWIKKPIKRKLALMPNGAIMDLTDGNEENIAAALAGQARIEERPSEQVCRYLITASDILEGPSEWPGRFIPIVPVIGEEIRIGRKLIRNGVVRHAQDPQRMYNYFRSAQTETVALQPKAPFLVTETNVAKYQSTWETANTKNLPYLPYEPDSKNGGAAPQRVAPPVSSQGINEGVMMAAEDLKGVIGIYDAGLGNQSNETSGKAIMARQREGDVGSYLYVDNFARAIRHTGNIIVDLIPKVYDSERTIRILGEDGKVDSIDINKAKGVDELGETVYENDVTVGSYDVVATVGPSYTTRREEAREGMLAFIQAAPEVAPLILDKVAKAQDWPMSDEIAKRIRATLPPNILKMEEMEEQGADPEQIKQAMAEQQQPPPDPEMIKAQAQIEMEGQRLQFDQQKAQQESQLEQARMSSEQEGKQAELQMRMAEMEMQAQLKREEMQLNAELKREEMHLDAQIKRETAQITAEVKARDADLRAETAKYATDNKPEPKKATAKKAS